MKNSDMPESAATAAQQTDLAGQASENKYRLLFDCAADAIFIHDSQAHMLAVNPQACRYLGYTHDELMTLTIAQIDSPDEAKNAAGRIAELMANGRLSFETVHRRKDKSLVAVEVNARRIEWDGQQAMMSVCRDITARKKVDQALQEAEWKFRALFEKGPIGVAYHEMIYDAQGKAVDYRFLDANETYLELTGVDPRGKTVLQAFPGIEKDPFDWIGTFGKVARTGQQIRFESYLQANNRWYDVVGYQYQPDHFVAAFVNITARKQAEIALQGSEARFRTMVGGMPVGVLLHGKATEILLSNPKALELLGLSEAQLMGKTSMDPDWAVIHEDGSPFPGETHPASRAIATREAVRGVVMGVFRPMLKDRVWLSVDAEPLLDEDGSVRQVVVSFIDITARKQAEAENAKLEGQLLQAQKMESVGRLAGGVAHDFNNMLGVILGHVEMALEEVDLRDPLHGSLTEIRKAAYRSAALTRQLLAFARKATVAPKLLNLNETVAGTLTMLQRLIGEDIELKWLPSREIWPTMVDPSQVDQILANLCVNARDAIAGIGKMTIETGVASFDAEYCTQHSGYLEGDFVRLSVSDNGCGIDKEALPHIFEPFFTTKGVGQGTGLGLATVYGIVKQNNGFITLYSELGQGSTFSIYLPRHLGGTESVARPEVAEPIARGHETILLVEDEQGILEMATRMLERQGYTVLAAASPAAAVRLARSFTGKIHLLMTDVVMPEMNGRELANHLHDLFPHLKCVFMSGYTADVIAHQGVLDEGVLFLQKPFAIKDLSAKVREALD